MNSPITSIKVRFPKKSQRVRKRYKAVKGRETKLNRSYGISEKSLIAAGVVRDRSYMMSELKSLLGAGNGLINLVSKLPKLFTTVEYATGVRVIKRKLACYSGEDLYKLVILRDAGEIPRNKNRNFNDNSVKLPSTLYINPKRKNRKVKKVACEHCGCVIPKNKRKPKKLSYTEMLRQSGKFTGVLNIRKNVISGRRSYVRDKE